MNSVDLCKLGSLAYPIMLTQEMGEISEAKAAELLAVNIENYREIKHQAAAAIMGMVESLPCPLTLLLAGTLDQPKSSTKGEG